MVNFVLKFSWIILMIGHRSKYLFLLFIVFAFLFLQRGFSQKIPIVSGNISFQGLIYNGDLAPLWHTARQEGRWNNLAGNQLIGTALTKLQWQPVNQLSVHALAEVDNASGFYNNYLHSGWVGITFKSLSLKGGKHLFDPIFTKAYSGSGSYLFGTNYRPVSRITLEIPHYVSVPFTHDRVQVRGGMSQGWLPDQPLSGDVLLHEKYAYLRWNGRKLKSYAGLNHSSLFGGERNGNEIPVDFLATFFAEGSEKIGEGEASNAAGAHMGLYDFGIVHKSNFGEFHFYYQIPFSDGSGMRFWKRNRDQIVGMNWIPRNNSWLNNLTVEWLNTSYQSGNGMPDAGALIDDKFVSLKTILRKDDISEFMSQYFGIERSDWGDNEIFQVLKEDVNHGNKFGGRDGYMNNGTYPVGWSWHHYVMGNPFNITKYQLLAVAADREFQYPVFIKNDRFKGLHLGGGGAISSVLHWKMMVSFTRNYGTYFEQYKGRYTWTETEDYWFKGGRDQWYTMLELNWRPAKLPHYHFFGGLAYDYGDLFESAGLKIGVNYRL
jgi:hypothetical protein